jgi:hypothetical protein
VDRREKSPHSIEGCQHQSIIDGQVAPTLDFSSIVIIRQSSVNFIDGTWTVLMPVRTGIQSVTAFIIIVSYFGIHTSESYNSSIVYKYVYSARAKQRERAGASGLHLEGHISSLSSHFLAGLNVATTDLNEETKFLIVSVTCFDYRVVQ